MPVEMFAKHHRRVTTHAEADANMRFCKKQEAEFIKLQKILQEKLKVVQARKAQALATIRRFMKEQPSDTLAEKPGWKTPVQRKNERLEALRQERKKRKREAKLIELKKQIAEKKAEKKKRKKKKKPLDETPAPQQTEEAQQEKKPHKKPSQLLAKPN